MRATPTRACTRPRAAWWKHCSTALQPVGLPWVAALGFIRLTTHRQILARPIPVSVACAHVRAWLARPSVAILHPGNRHADVLFALLEHLGSAGNLTTDATWRRCASSTRPSCIRPTPISRGSRDSAGRTPPRDAGPSRRTNQSLRCSVQRAEPAVEGPQRQVSRRSGQFDDEAVREPQGGRRPKTSRAAFTASGAGAPGCDGSGASPRPERPWPRRARRPRPVPRWLQREATTEHPGAGVDEGIGDGGLRASSRVSSRTKHVGANRRAWRARMCAGTPSFSALSGVRSGRSSLNKRRWTYPEAYFPERRTTMASPSRSIPAGSLARRRVCGAPRAGTET